MIVEKLKSLGEYSAAGLFEEPERDLFYRKSLGIRRFYETCPIPYYSGEKLYPSGWVTGGPSYLHNLWVNYEVIDKENKDIGDKIRADFERYVTSVPGEHSVAGNMFTHSMPNYERILAEGFNGYLKRIEKIKDKDMREGLCHVVKGIEKYIERCLEHLRSVGAEEKLVKALEKVPMNPAEDIYEAIVGWNFIMYLDGCDNLGSLASGLYPYYKGEDITELLDSLFTNFDVRGGYSMALNNDYNPITLQCLEVSKGKRRPMIELFVDENTPDEVWKKAFEVIRTANGQPAFYNSKVLLNGLQKKFPNITDEDIKKFCGGGCTESMIAGKSNVGSLDAGIHLLYLLEICMKEQLESSESFEEFYGKYIKSVKEVVDKVTEEISNSRKNRAKYNPIPMRTLLIDDCIDKGVEYNNGGARYNWSIINFAGLINVIDSLLVIRDVVFGSKEYGAKEFLAKLEANDEEFLKKMREHEICFGRDNDDANAFTTRISTEIFSMLDDKEVYQGEGFLPASIQFMSQVDAGKVVGATPDGRSAQAPLCDSLAAIFGKDNKGPTALLNSVTSLNLERVLGIPVLNFNLNPDFKDEILKALILGYMNKGGIQMQMTCISREILEDAYRNPEMYKNLVVRVGGYSEYFYYLTDELKRMVINRTIQK